MTSEAEDKPVSGVVRFIATLSIAACGALAVIQNAKTGVLAEQWESQVGSGPGYPFPPTTEWVLGYDQAFKWMIIGLAIVSIGLVWRLVRRTGVTGTTMAATILFVILLGLV